MIKWWQLRPIIPSLPFFDEDISRKEVIDWMNEATDEIERLQKENEELQANLDLVFEYDSNLLDYLKRRSKSLGEK